MKTPLSFLLLFLFLLGFGQKTESTRSYQIEKYCNEQNKIYLQLEKDFKRVDFSKLYIKIVSDFDLEKIKDDNLVFHFRNLENERRGSVFEDEWICENNSLNPFYNQVSFWNKKTIKYIQKKLNKNLIPFLQRIDDYVFVDNSEENLDERTEYYYFRESKKLIELTKKQSKGTLIKKYKRFDSSNKVETVDEKKEFYYFPYNKDKLELITLQGENQNFDTVFLEFLNKPGKIVVVKFKYNLDEPISKDEDTVYKTYQYQNNKWVEIPTTDEYKF